MSFPFGSTITLVIRTLSGQDASGNDEYTNTNVDVGPCVIVPGTSSETVEFTDQVNTTMQFFVPYGTDVGYLDAILYNGDKYEIQGVPDQWVSPFSGHTAPIRIQASRVTGASV